MKNTAALAIALFAGASGVSAAEYDLEYETAGGWVQVGKSTSSLSTAVSGVKSGGTIRLLDDITDESAATLASKSYVLDGQNHTITIAGTRLTFLASDAQTVVTLKNLTLTATAKQAYQLFQTSYRGKFIFDNAVVRDFSSSAQIFLLQSGTVRLTNGSRIENISTDTLFAYTQSNGSATQCGDTGYTNLVEVVGSTISGITTKNDLIVPLYQARFFPAVFRMANSALTGCTLEYGINMNDRNGTKRESDGGSYQPELYLEDGASITNNAFSVAAVKISPENEGCKVEFAGNLTIRGNGNDVVFENRFDTLPVRSGVSGEIRVTSPRAPGDRFAVAGGGTDLSAFKVTGDDSIRAVLHDGMAVWAKVANGLMLIFR